MSDTHHESVHVASGKYTVMLCDDGSSVALRYGQPWPAYPDGLNNLETALARDLIEAREILGDILTELPIDMVNGHLSHLVSVARDILASGERASR